jgi:iron complex outermembrane receptor protein
MTLAGEPVGYALVALPQGLRICCNKNGEFSFPADSFLFPFKIAVSALNFRTREINVSHPNQELTIRLAPLTYLLDDVPVVCPQKQRQSNVALFEIDRETVDERMPLHVTDLLGSEAGFTQRSGYQAPLILRGLSGKRLLVLRDGNRRFSSYPAGFMSHTINVYDLERIVVEKGAASVRYGSGAMAGIVNLLDAFSFQTNGIKGKLTAGYGTNNNERTVLSSVNSGNNKLASGLNFRIRKADNSVYPDGTAMENSFYEDKDFLFKSAWRPSGQHCFHLLADLHRGGPWGKPKGFNGTDYMLATTNVENTDNVSLSWMFEPENRNWVSKASVYYSHEKRELEKRFFTAANYRLSFQEITDYTDYYYGAGAEVTYQPTKKMKLICGAAYYSFHISSPTESNDYIQNLSFRNRVSINARSYVAGTFSELIFKLNAQSKVVTGLRFDYDWVKEGEVYDLDQTGEGETTAHAFSGSVAYQNQLSETSQLKINLARSFRLPETTELFADNYTSNGILYGNTALQPEFCYGLDADWQFQFGSVQVEVSPFIWLLKDMINKEEVKGQPGTNYQYINIGKARLWGGELTFNWTSGQVLFTGDLFHFYCGLSYLNGTDVTAAGTYFGSGDPLDFVPPFNLKSELNYKWKWNKNISSTLLLGAVYYAKQHRLPEGGYATPSYLETDLSAGIRCEYWPGKPDFRFVVNNLLNGTYQSFQSYLPAKGRDFRFYITFKLN